MIPASIHVKLNGLPKATPVQLAVSAVRSDWRRVVGVDANGEATVATIWKELVVAVVVEGRVLGAVYLGPGGSTRFTIRCDPTGSGGVAVVDTK
jgi:hypothetical protein